MPYRTIDQYNEDLAGTPLDFVISLVADHRNMDSTSLPELDKYIEGNLINRFLRQPPATGDLRFQWGESTVKLYADRTVEVATIGGKGAKVPTNRNEQKSAQWYGPRAVSKYNGRPKEHHN